MALDFPASGNALWSIFDKTGIRPEYLLPMLWAESNFLPSVQNHAGAPYYGLNQVSATFLASLGVSPADYLTWAASRQLSGVVLPYMQGVVAKLGVPRSGTRVEQANFYPASLATATGLTDVIVSAPSSAYESNKDLDFGKTGTITVQDLATFLTNAMAGSKGAVGQAIASTYALRPTESPMDPIYGTDFGGLPAIARLPPWVAVTGAAAILAAAGGVAWMLLAPAREVPRPLRSFAMENPVARDADPPSMVVQSLLFPRDRFNVPEAKRWARAHGYVSSDVELTSGYIHLVQMPTRGFKVIRTIPLGREGIKAHVAREA